jgi:hypothetical protein
MIHPPRSRSAAIVAASLTSPTCWRPARCAAAGTASPPWTRPCRSGTWAQAPVKRPAGRPTQLARRRRRTSFGPSPAHPPSRQVADARQSCIGEGPARAVDAFVAEHRRNGSTAASVLGSMLRRSAASAEQVRKRDQFTADAEIAAPGPGQSADRQRRRSPGQAWRRGRRPARRRRAVHVRLDVATAERDRGREARIVFSARGGCTRWAKGMGSRWSDTAAVSSRRAACGD